MKYFVAKNLKHDNRAYERGEEVELTEDSAAPLLEDGVIQTAPAVDPVSPANLDRVQRSTKKPKAGKDEPTVGGEATVTGEPSIDGQEGPQTPAEDVTPATDQEPSIDGQEEPQTPAEDVTPATDQEPSIDGQEGTDPSADL